MSKKRHVRLVEMDGEDTIGNPTVRQEGINRLPPASDPLAMDDLSDIEMRHLTTIDDEDDADNIMILSRELDFVRDRLSAIEKTVRSRRCMPCGVRIICILVVLLIVGLVVNYGFDFSHVILAFLHEKGLL